jgi:cytolysin-activating lysine-acyltransferase
MKISIMTHGQNQASAANPELSLVNLNEISDPLGAVIQLMMLSSLHRRWTIGDVERLIVPSIEYEQSLFAVMDKVPVAFASWALFSEESRLAFVNQLRPLNKQDWQSGKQLWVIDFIGPFGLVPKAAQLLKQYLCDRYPENKEAFAIRYKDHGRVRRLSRWPR